MCLALQADARQCVEVASINKPLHFQLALDTADFQGAGLLTVALEHSSIESSVYVHLTGYASQVTVDLTSDALQTQHRPEATTADRESPTRGSDSRLTGDASLTVPAPLMYGAAIQLQTQLPSGHVRDLPCYAVSEELISSLAHSPLLGNHSPPQTFFDSTLPGMLGLTTNDRLACPAAADRDSLRPQQHQKVEEANVATPPSLWSSGRVLAVALPWCVSMCLMLCITGMAISDRCRSSTVSNRHAVQAEACQAEPSYVRSNQELITPTKDTGCSPFIRVTQAPMPRVTFGHDYMASCSSKIGSHKAARPATSKAVTNMTSNVSGHTKWQRSKNGRLLSLALDDPDELTS